MMDLIIVTTRYGLFLMIQPFMPPNIIQLNVNNIVLMVYNNTRNIHIIDILYFISLSLHFINHTLSDELNFMEYDIYTSIYQNM